MCRFWPQYGRNVWGKVWGKMACQSMGKKACGSIGKRACRSMEKITVEWLGENSRSEGGRPSKGRDTKLLKVVRTVP